MVDIQSATAEIRQGIKKERRSKKPQGKNIIACPIPQGGIKSQRLGKMGMTGHEETITETNEVKSSSILRGLP